jgi:hypothetical protein
MVDSEQTSSSEVGKTRLDQIGASDGDGYHSATPSMYSLIESNAPPPASQPTSKASPPQTLPLAQIQNLIGGDHDFGHQAIGNEEGELDSAYDSESLLGDDTMTLASYITDYRYEHGRRYHAYRDGAYWVSRVNHVFGRIVRSLWILCSDLVSRDGQGRKVRHSRTGLMATCFGTTKKKTLCTAFAQNFVQPYHEDMPRILMSLYASGGSYCFC